MGMDDALERFLGLLSPDVRDELDYSPSSLFVLEAWLLSTYADPDRALAASESKIVDGAARYIGEVFRKNLGAGKWFIEFSDKKNAFYGLPQLKGLPNQKVQVCPLTLVTSAIDRRTGKFLESIYLNNQRNANL